MANKYLDVSGLTYFWGRIKSYANSAANNIEAMRFKGSLGENGDVTTLPSSGVKVGDSYIVVDEGIYASLSCGVGDLIIATSTTPTWTVVQSSGTGVINTITGISPVTITGSGSSRQISVGEASVSTSGLMTAADKTKLNGIAAGAQTGTVTSVGITNNGGLTIVGSPITTSGTMTIGHSNSVSQQTTQAVYPITIDSYGHIASYGTAVTIPTIPSDNTSGSGTSGYLAKWNGSNSLTNGPQLGSSTTTFLRNDGNWAAPPASANDAVTQTATTTNAVYELLFSETADNTTRTEGARKTSTLTYNPSSKLLSTGGKISCKGLLSHTGTDDYDAYITHESSSIKLQVCDYDEEGYPTLQLIRDSVSIKFSDSGITDTVFKTTQDDEGNISTVIHFLETPTSSSDAATKGYVDTSLNAKQNTIITRTGTLTTAGWSNNSQTISVSGVTANNIVIISPTQASVEDYSMANIKCTAQNSGSLTFSCAIVPSNAITINIVII